MESPMPYIAASFLFLLAGCSRPEPADAPAVLVQQTSQGIDSPAKLVASMTTYHVGIVWKGPNWSEGAQAKIAEKIQSTSDIWKTAIVEGKLVGAVRIEEPVDLWGLLFFKTDSMKEMQSIADNALSVKEGLLKSEVVKVWGPRGLGKGLAEALMENAAAEMKSETFYMVVYRKGENWSEKSDDPSTREATAEGMQYLFDLYKSGTLRYYAAVEDMTRPARGIAIINAASREEAMGLAAKGPMVEKKWLTAEVVPVFIVGGTLP